MGFQSGKLPHAFLRKMIRYSGSPDKRVLLGPKIGEDAAAIDFGDFCVILKTDPITYAIEDIGWYAVHINANDVATMGARPKWFQTVLLLPQKMSPAGIEKIFKQVDAACRQLGVAVTGGHTEITPWLDRPVIVGDMHGVCNKDELVFTSGAKVGDRIVLTKGAGIEGTAVIAREMKRALLKKFSKSFVNRAERYLYKPGISVVPEAMVGSTVGATCMHDPTEGGVATGLYEIAAASGKGIVVEREQVHIREETRRICDFFDLDPMGLLSSGALLLTFPPKKAEQFVDVVATEDVEACIIGRITRKSEGLKIVEDGKSRTLRYSQRDELLRIL
jgi:hydrogenase expression/formation protein HypE